MIEFLVVALAQAAAGEPQTSAPAQPAAATETVVTQVQVEVAPEDRIVCRRIIRTGTRMPERRCLTVRDQEAVREGARQAVNAQQQSGLLRGGSDR